MMETLKNCTEYDKRSIRDNLKFVGWVFAWMASMTLSDKAAKYGWWSAEWMSLLSIAVNAGFGLWVIHNYRRLLSGMDELQRKIQLDALSLALGVSLVGACSYTLLVTWGYIVDEEVSDIFFLMCMSYAASVIFGSLKYR